VFTWQLWDLTAGKLMHDFKYHEGQVQCLDFHPHEFLLATGISLLLLIRTDVVQHPGF
jgi:WD40 repeat protein